MYRSHTMPAQSLSVLHRTVYTYRQPVGFGTHRLMLRPRDSHDLRLRRAELSITPDPTVRWLHDVFGNSVAAVDFEMRAEMLAIESVIELDRFDDESGSLSVESYARTLPFSYPASEVPDLGRMIERHYPDPTRRLTEWTRRFLHQGIGTTQTEKFLLDVTGAIKDEFRYEERHDPGLQAPVETLERGAGSCRDFALFMIEAARSVGLAARFVSGYLYDPAIDGGDLGTTGAGATHAWVQIYLPGAGWVEFDPTNGAAGGHNLVRVAVAREPQQAMPVSGSFDGAAQDFLDLTVEVEVRSLDSARAMDVA